ncbi:DNA polymerase alpha catalytic subunit-like [Vicia villosa]|uniref:DNA polymerase alpha catalytic subunit-like n=1 Tax=Vicia villosa TaxID=3911 RepID=UPI00273A88B5|nr:DNA polymerase alpha catalytic subunit-like [Vicia villosa]
MIELHKMDSDVLVGHNISGFDLDVLLHRSQACKVPSSLWSKLGRLNRSTMPKLERRGKTFGFGTDPAIMSCVAGRLLCDTYLCSRDLLKEVSYSLTHLAKTQLNQSRKEVAPHDIPKMFQSAKSLMELEWDTQEASQIVNICIISGQVLKTVIKQHCVCSRCFALDT